MRPRISFALLLSRLLCACVDTEPVDFHDERDSGLVLDGSDLLDGGTTRCRACLTEADGGCPNVYATCKGIADCPDFVTCAVDLACFSYSELADRIACVDPCIKKYSVTGTNPMVTTLVQLNACSQGACQEACVRSD